MKTSEAQKHNISPIWDANSEVLILGSFPSVKSRKDEFFYAHPQNRFWRVMAYLFDDELPQSVEDKRRLLLSHGVALWDVIASCQIKGSSDSSIQKVEPNDIMPIIKGSRISRIYVNGLTAGKLYDKYIYPLSNIKAVRLPSTSPANATITFERLCEAWKIITEKEGRQ